MVVFQKTIETFTPGAMTLPGYYYTSSEILNAELEHIFYDGWVCIGREAQLINPGDYVLAKVGEENILVLRDLDGTLRAFHNVCRHRGTVICTTPRGHYSQCIRCPYHGWTYDLTGQLIAAPLMDEVSSFKKADYPLHSVAVHSWEGFLFLNLSPNPKPFANIFQPLMGRFQQWQLPALRAARTVEYEVNANWKIIVENYLECYHCPLIHHEFTRQVHYRSGKNDFYEGPFLGGFMELKPDIASLTRSGRRCGPPLGSVSGVDRSRVYFYSIFPNLTLSLHPDYVMSFHIWPLDCDRTKVICEWLFPATALDEGKCDPDDAVQFWDNANREDWEMCALVQQGVKSRSYGPSPYSNTESLPIAFISEVMRALDHHHFVDSKPESFNRRTNWKP